LVCWKLSLPLLAQPAEFCVELLDAPEEPFLCGERLEFSVRIKHAEPGLCGFLMGLSVRDAEDEVLPGLELNLPNAFSMDAVWQFGGPRRNEQGLTVGAPCQEPMPTVPPATPVGVLRVTIPYPYEGSFRVHFDDPIPFGSGEEEPLVVFGPFQGGPITLTDSDLYSVRCPVFVRGDSNDDGDVNIADPITVLQFLFSGQDVIRCKDAADVDDNGAVTMTDPINLLNYLFIGGPAPATPFEEPGPDPAPDELPCEGLYPA
jgi:hypothetical protein